MLPLSLTDDQNVFALDMQPGLAGEFCMVGVDVFPECFELFTGKLVDHLLHGSETACVPLPDILCVVEIVIVDAGFEIQLECIAEQVPDMIGLAPRQR